MNIKTKLIKNIYWILIVFLALVFRFSFYQQRIILNQDQGRDAVIALHALRNNLIPEIGSPSSAGPFNFGPWYFWSIMFWEKILPFNIGPWIGFTLMSVITVLLYAAMGKMLSGKTGIITGIIAAISFGPVINSTDMLNTVIVGFSSSLAFYSAISFLKKQKLLWLILCGFAVGLSINFHFQSMGLLSLLLLLVLLNNYSILKRIKIGLITGVGLFISFIPLFWFDFHRNFVWIKSVFEYYTIGVKKFYVPVRWLTEITDFWPRLFGSVTTGFPSLGYIWVLLGLLVIILFIVKKEKIEKSWIFLGVSFLIQILLIRYYQGARSREYFIAIHGYIILICSWILINLIKFSQKIGILILIIFLSLTTFQNYQTIKKYPSQANLVFSVKKELDLKVKENINIFQYQDSNMFTMPLFYLYYFQNRVSDDGKAIGICDSNRHECPQKFFLEKNNYRLYELNSPTETAVFNQVTSRQIYEILYINYGLLNKK
jgi:hypothetical protein